MNTEEIINNCKEKVLQKIQNGEVKMRPKSFFVAKVLILSIVSIVIFVLSVLLMSYTWFSLKTGGHIFLLGFGGRGFYEFFLLFPWLLLLLDVGLIIALDWLIKRFRFGYHNPVLVIFGGSLIVITIFGTVVNMTSFHKNMMNMAEEKKLPVPVVGGFYTELRKTHKERGLFRGEVVSVATSSFYIKSSKYDEDQSLSNLEVSVPIGFDAMVLLNVGDEVFIAGDFASGTIRAYGVRKLTAEY